MGDVDGRCGATTATVSGVLNYKRKNFSPTEDVTPGGSYRIGEKSGQSQRPDIFYSSRPLF
jgi:hypothetical protein